MKPVYLEWYDHASRHGWITEEQVSDPDYVYPVLNYTVGWVVEETKEYVIISHSINADSCCDPLVILKRTITKRMDIKSHIEKTDKKPKGSKKKK